MNKRNRVARVSARFQKPIVPDEDAEGEAEGEEEIDKLENDEDTEPQQKDQTERKGDDRGFESEGEGTEQSRHRQRRRDSPSSRVPALERAPSQGVLTSMRLPGFTKRTPVRHMGFIVGRGKRRNSVAQRIADETFALSYDEDEDEESEVDIHSNEKSMRLSGRHQEADFGEVTELQIPKRQRRTRLNPDLYPAVTYQSETTFFHLLQSSLTLWSQRFELASGLGLKPEL